MRPDTLVEAERLTLGVLLTGVAALSFSDFVSPAYWSLVVLVALLRLWRGPVFSLTELQASLIGWAGFVWVGLELVLGRDFLVAFTDFLLILALAVVVEAATPRNHLHRLIVGLFLILAGAVLTDSVLYALPLAAFVLLLWRAARRLYGMHLPGGDLDLGGWRGDVRLFALMLASTAALFVLLPRVGYGSLLQNVQRHLTTSGFSDRVQLGDFARELDPTVVMRVEAKDMPVADFRRRMRQRYWRGLALSRYDRGGWRHLPEAIQRQWPARSDARLNGAGDWHIIVYREAMDHPYVFVPDGMAALAETAEALRLDAAGALSFITRPQRRLRLKYAMSAEANQVDMRPPNAWERQAPHSPVIHDWALEVVGEAASDGERLRRLVTELSSWQYDLQAPIDAQHPVEHFISASRRGHCELFASALALAARALGIPARVVNGYYGGDWNDIGEFLLIRQQHAHTWVEAWLEGRWQRLDATPASRWNLSGVRFAAFDRVWESLKLAWYRYVLDFRNQDRSTLWAQVKQLLHGRAIWAAALLAVPLLWFGRRLQLHKHRKRPPGWTVLDRWLYRHGLCRHPAQPLRLVPLPGGVPPSAWHAFVRDWERQAFGAASAMSRWVLRARLRALSEAHW